MALGVQFIVKELTELLRMGSSRFWKGVEGSIKQRFVLSRHACQFSLEKHSLEGRVLITIHLKPLG